jgi:type IV pilus assembly protein PilA
MAFVIAALAIPQLPSFKKHANETSAIYTMHTIGQAEMTYYSADPATGFACQLSALGGDPKSSTPTPQAAQLIDPTLASTGQKAGYTFTLTCGPKATVDNKEIYASYKVVAVPQSIGKTGDHGYCSDENNIIKFDPTGGTNCTQTLNLSF